MPLTPTSAVGKLGIVIEGNSGVQTLLAATAVSGTITGFNAPTGSTGMRLWIRITNWTASGTFTINGTGTPNSSEGAITVAGPTAQQSQSPQLTSFDYVSTNAFTAITNITTTGLANAIFTVYGIQAAKFNIPVTSFKSERKTPIYSPQEHNGLMARDKKLIATHNDTTISNLDSDFYGDLSLYWVYMMLGIPTWTTLPVSPTSIVASATITTNMTIANQPTAPGMKLIFTVSGFTGNPAITITGTSYGLTTSETVTITGNGTFYSTNVYSAITTIGGTINGTTVAVTGVFGWKGVVNEEATRQTAAVEFFDGSASWTHPFTCSTDGDCTINAKAEVKLTMKAVAQDKIAIGDRTTNPLQTSRIANIGTPLNDLPLAGWQTLVYLDSITGTAQSTVLLDLDEEVKIVLKTPTELHYTFNNTQNFTRAYPMKPDCIVDLAYDIINLLQNEQYRQNLKQTLVVATIGRLVGTTGGSAYYEGWTWQIPGRYDGDFPIEGDPKKGSVFAKPKWRAEYDATLGAAYQLTIITQNPPTYNA